MKFIKTVLAIFILSIALMCIVGCSGNAGGGTLFSQGSVEGVEGSDAKISEGLNVIAHQNTMAIAGLKGNPLSFSKERFACAMNTSDISYINITSLPDDMCGALYIGSEGVSEGQRISASDLALMTYEEHSDGIENNASFKFTVNGGAYEMTCNLYMLDEINYSPTLSLASYVSLNSETYKNISMSGVLSAYDPEGDEMVFEIVRYPENGILTINDKTKGTYTYVPDVDFSGEDSFSYVAVDKYGNYSAAEEIVISVRTAGVSTQYSDLTDHEIHRHAIAMTECGLMNGVQVGDYYYFEADREVSRAEFIITAMNAVGIKSVPEVEKTVFEDDADIYPEMKGYVALAYSKGYISGIEKEGKLYFRPDESIKLSEAAVILSNIIGYAQPKVTPVFADADTIPTWSNKAIQSLHTLGILELPDMVTGACENVTRGDMAKLLNKAMYVIGK